MTETKIIVPPFVVAFSKDEEAILEERAIEIIKSQWLVLGKWTKQLEELMAQHTGHKYAVTTNSGSSALEISYRALSEIDPGQKRNKILIPSNTNYSDAMSAISAGFTPVLYDSGLFPDMEHMASIIDDEVLAVVVVHIGGYITPEILKIKSLCHSKGVALIEDCAHAHGASIYGKRAGSFGDLAAFSFFVTKTVPAGEGGCIVHSNDVLQDPVQLMPNQGKASHETIHRYLGGSLRITEFSAAMAHMRMGTIDAFNAKRRFFMAHFSKASSDVLQPVAMGHETSEPGGYKCIWMVKKGLRTAVCDLAKDMGVTLARPVYEVPLHRQPILFPHADPGEFPQAEAFTSADGHICLPMWHAMEPEHIERVDAFLHECQKLAL